MNMNEVIAYEKKRLSIINKMKELENITMNEIVVLSILRECSLEKINLKFIRHEMNKLDVPFQRPIQYLYNKGFFKKNRSLDDERSIELTHIDYDRIDDILKKLKTLLEEI